MNQTIESALHLLGAWLLFGTISLTLPTWMFRRLYKRWHEMAFWTKLGASVVAVPVALGALSTLFGLAMVTGAIIGDPSKKAYLLPAGLDGVVMGTAFVLFFCLANPVFFSEVTPKPETRRRRLIGQQTRDSSPPEQ